MKMPVALSLCLLAASVSSAFGQTAPAAAAATPAPKTADSDTPSDSHIAAALDLLLATHVDQSYKAMLDGAGPLQTQVIKQIRPNLDDAAIAVIVRKLHDSMLTRQGDYLHIYALAYARDFGEQELKDLAAFYRSALGQKYIATLPSVLNEATPAVNQWMQGVALQAQQDLLKDLPPKPGDKP
jgi:hypothetical protein